NIIIDGNNSVNDNKLKIKNTYNASADIHKAGIMLYNNANNNVFKKLTIELNIIDTTKDVFTIGVFAGGSSIGEPGNNSFVEVSDIVFINVSQSVYVNGGSDTTNWKISGNTVGSPIDFNKPSLGV